MDYLAMGYRCGNWELFVNGTVNHNNTLTTGTTTNTLVYNGRKTVVGSSQHNSYPTVAGTVKSGFDYTGGAQSFGAYYRYNPERGDFGNSGTEWLDNNPALYRDIDKRIRSHSHLASLYYENTFSEKYMLHFDGDFRQSNTDNSVATTYPPIVHPRCLLHRKTQFNPMGRKAISEFPVMEGRFNRRNPGQSHPDHTRLPHA